MLRLLIACLLLCFLAPYAGYRLGVHLMHVGRSLSSADMTYGKSAVMSLPGQSHTLMSHSWQCEFWSTCAIKKRGMKLASLSYFCIGISEPPVQNANEQDTETARAARHRWLPSSYKDPQTRYQ